MDIKQLEYFVKVCESGSFTQAANRNYISPQGINSAILRLEKELGAQLLKRSSRGVEPTVHGEFLYQKAHQIMGLLKECNDHFQTVIVEETVPSMALTTDLLSIMPMTACKLILNKYKMDIKLKGSYACENDLLNGNCSFALVDGGPFNPKLLYQKCFSIEHILVVNKLHELAGMRKIALRDLEKYRFVIVNATFKEYGNFVNLCMENNFIPQIEMYTNSLSETYQILHQRTDLIGISYDCYKARSDEADIVSLHLADLSWPYDVYLAYCKSTRFSYTEKNFFSDFLGSFSDQTIL